MEAVNNTELIVALNIFIFPPKTEFEKQRTAFAAFVNMAN